MYKKSLFKGFLIKSTIKNRTMKEGFYMVNKKIFFDLQTGGYSSHTTIEGLAEFLKDDLMAVEEYEGEFINAFNYNEEEGKRRLIESYDYEILDYTPENIYAYEKYHK